MNCLTSNIKRLVFTFSTFIVLPVLLILLVNNVAKAAKLSDGVWTQSADPGTTTVTFTNVTALAVGSDIVLTFPNTAAVSNGGTNVAVTGQTTPTRSNNTLDNTITITLDGTLNASLAVTITMTDALSSYTTTTYAQESLAINTQNSTDVPQDFGVAIKTNDNTTTRNNASTTFCNICS